MSSNSLKFKIEGMTCAACVGVIEKEVGQLKGVDSVQVNFATETGEFKVSDAFELEVFHGLLKKLGYRASLPDAQKSQNRESIFNRDFYRALISLIFATLTMFFAMVVPNNLVQGILATILLLAFGWPYIKSILLGKGGMNTLIGLGVLSSYLYSLYLVINNHHAHPYFEGGAFILAFSLVGHYLDGLAKTKARSNLSSLYKMQVKFASRIMGSAEVSTAVIDLKEGDIIRLRPGEKFPLDGEVLEGETHCDESMLTGESKAVSKAPGAKVFAGSMNLEGSVILKITSTLHSTLVSNIVQFVEKAQLKKAPIQLYADRIVKLFVPMVVIISVFTFITWFFIAKDSSLAITHMISVLVIACPCALGLAVPMVIMLSTSEVAKDGLLISGGDVIEKGSHIDTIVFDKTGTLTEGRPELMAVVVFEKSFDETNLLILAASSMQYSAHPLSQSIANAALKKDLKLFDPEKFKSLAGLGVISEIEGKKIALGNAELLKQENTSGEIPVTFYDEHVGSYVFMSINQKLIAAFVIADPVKKEAPELIKYLHALKFNVWMLTGDHQGVANKIGTELGISSDFIRAGVKPVGKADFIKELQQRGFKVAMVGDGINDAPALAKADLSIAMSTGSDVALETSEVSVLEGKLLLIGVFFSCANRSMKIIKENLILSSLYNILCIPLAAGAFYPWYKVSLTPMWASLAMGLSSFSVILNSFRVKKITL